MGGVFEAHDATTASEVQFALPKYVAPKLFIVQVALIQAAKIIKFLIQLV